uniref:Uncharacterized protein n=1 Tax=Arcella intermedia TaxID=1963864 RepID=A0A6B2LKS9_9EUKA
MGSGGVGKSAITVQYISGVFIARYDPTIEESYRKPLEIDGKTLILEVMDTAGTEQFTAMRDLYLRNGQGFVLVFSLISETTYNDVAILRNQILKVKEGEENIPMVLAGNKADMVDKRAVSPSDCKSLALKFGGHYYETSAKTNTNINQIFDDLVRQVLIKYPFPKKKKNCNIL